MKVSTKNKTSRNEILFKPQLIHRKYRNFDIWGNQKFMEKKKKKNSSNIIEISCLPPLPSSKKIKTRYEIQYDDWRAKPPLISAPTKYVLRENYTLVALNNVSKEAVE